MPADGRPERLRGWAGIFERTEAQVTLNGGVRIVAVPKEGWKGIGEWAVLELQTGACSKFSDIQTRLQNLAAAIGPP